MDNQTNLSESNKTIIAYRPNGEDSIRGCLMGSSHSEFDILTTNDHRKFIEFWVEKLKQQWKHRDEREYASWQISIVDTTGELHELEYCTPEYLEQPIKGWYDEAQGRFEKWKEVELGFLSAKAEAQRRAERDRLQQQDKATLRALLEKYPEVLK